MQAGRRNVCLRVGDRDTALRNAITEMYLVQGYAHVTARRQPARTRDMLHLVLVRLSERLVGRDDARW